jgi:ribokinase
MAEIRPIVVVGSINIDLVASTVRIPVEGETVTGNGFQVHPGGKGANQAVAVARLGHPVQMIGRVGDDDFGAQLKQHLVSAGVDVSGVATSAGASGVAVIIVSEAGSNVIVVVPGANGLLTPGDIDAHIDMIRSAGIVLTQLEIPMETTLHLAHICKREGIELVLDPAPARELPPQLLPMVTWLTPNESEAAFYVQDTVGQHEAIAQRLNDIGATGIVLKLGAKGAYISATGEPRTLVPSFEVKAVDSTAAGDCFNGAFAVGLTSGKGAVESARFAAAAAAISVTRAGAQPSMPTLLEVEQFLQAPAEPAATR